MSKEEIIEGNKLIAEFMGWKPHSKHGEGYLQNKDKNRVLPPFWTSINHEGRIDDFNYNSSWDWLTPVVEKIESFEVSVTIKNNRVWLYGWFENNPNTTTLYEWNGGQTNDNKITSTWYAVTEFIKWYNQQSK